MRWPPERYSWFVLTADELSDECSANRAAEQQTHSGALAAAAAIEAALQQVRVQRVNSIGNSVSFADRAAAHEAPGDALSREAEAKQRRLHRFAAMRLLLSRREGEACRGFVRPFAADS